MLRQFSWTVGRGDVDKRHETSETGEEPEGVALQQQQPVGALEGVLLLLGGEVFSHVSRWRRPLVVAPCTGAAQRLLEAPNMRRPHVEGLSLHSEGGAGMDDSLHRLPSPSLPPPPVSSRCTDEAPSHIFVLQN